MSRVWIPKIDVCLFRLHTAIMVLCAHSVVCWIAHFIVICGRFYYDLNECLWNFHFRKYFEEKRYLKKTQDRRFKPRKTKYLSWVKGRLRNLSQHSLCRTVPSTKVSRIRLGTQVSFWQKVKAWGCALDHSIDLTPKVPSCHVITAMHYLASLKILSGGWSQRSTYPLFTFSMNA